MSCSWTWQRALLLRDAVRQQRTAPLTSMPASPSSDVSPPPQRPVHTCRYERQLRVLDIQRKLYPPPDPSLVEPHREYVREGEREGDASGYDGM